MDAFFEIKYLDIKWYDKDTVTKITESFVALDVEFNEELNIFQAETTIYPKVKNLKNGILAIRLLNKEKLKPKIKIYNGEILYLKPVIDPDTNITWWIFKDKWDSVNNKWLSISPNVIGTLLFIFNRQSCEVQVNGSDFNIEQLEQYLDIFKDDLWEIILDDSSLFHNKIEGNNGVSISENIIECISSLISHTEKIIGNPKVELYEIQKLKPRKQVKPVNRTFMEVVTKTNQRFLTSRATEPSYNVSENRYILFVLESCYRIIKQIIILVKNKHKHFERMIDKLQRRHSSLVDYIRVEPNLVISDLNKLKEKCYLGFWQEKLQSLLKENGVSDSFSNCDDDLYLRIQGYTKEQQFEKKNGFFVQVWNAHNNSWEKPLGKTGVLRFNRISQPDFYKLIDILEIGMVLKFHCFYSYRKTDKAIFFEFDKIQYIELFDYDKIDKQKSNFEKERNICIDLKNNNWLRPLSKRELEEQKREKISLLNRIDFYTVNHSNYTYISEKIEPKFHQLTKLIRKLKRLKIKPSSHFPNSMTFVHNPHYQSVHNSYKILRNLTNLQDDNLLVSLEDINDIGIINMPLLYERWVLIQIIFVLKNNFRFMPQDDWKYKLVNAVKTNQKNIKITFYNEPAKRNIYLIYEYELPNAKRPDFTIDLTWFDENGNSHNKRFILDAKFYDKSTFIRAGGMLSKINELYTDKNYSEDNENPVFLIHPCKNIIDEPVTAQDWGKYSFLGEINFSRNENLPAHNKGAIFLNPIDNTLYRDELQRLLGMFLQYNLEDSKLYKDKDITLAKPICMQCGSTYFHVQQKTEKYFDRNANEWKERTSRSVWLKCKECDLWQVYNHCFNHPNSPRRLIKNGFYWTYHSARAIEPFNIKCPHCGEWGAWSSL